MKKVFSARKRLTRYFTYLLVTTLVLSLAYSVYSSLTYDSQLRYCSEAALDLSSGSLTQETDRLAFFNRHMTASSLFFRQAASLSGNDFTSISLLYQIQSIMRDTVPNTGLIMVFDDSGGAFRFIYGSSVLDNSVLRREHMQAAHMLQESCLSVPETDLDRWLVLECDPFVFLYRVNRYRHLYICSALELNAFAALTEQAGERSPQLFFDRDGVFITGRDSAEASVLRPESVYGLRSLFTNYNLTHREIPSLPIGLTMVMPKDGFWAFSRVSFLVMLSISTICIILYLQAYRMMKRFFVAPLRQISTLSKQMADVDEENIPQLRDPEPLEELDTLRESLNMLAAQKVHLRKRQEDEEAEKEHALLQYYQLQTRSHFFLNCLKSLYGMLETRAFTPMQEMIISFSNHLRYIFHDNLSQVPLRAEMDEVRDYHRIISMDSRQPLILTQEISPNAMTCLVPPLIVQTFLENSYKYNGRGMEALNFTVRIDRMEYEGRERLRIRLSDDGLGFSQDSLEELNRQTQDPGFDQYHIGISNLRRRMGILYKGDYDLAFFSGVSGGANVLISIPVQEEGGNGLDSAACG